MRRHAAFAYLAAALLAGAVGGVLVHEVGHYAACLYFGYEPGMTINLLESSVMCRAIGTESFIVSAAGGIPSSALFWAMLAPAPLRRSRYVGVFLLTGAITQAINAVLEVGLDSWYDETTRAIGFAAGLVLVLWIKRHQLPGRGPAA